METSIFGKKILILVPHPDDEVVSAAATYAHARAAGAELFTLYLTHGCIAQQTRWPWDRKNHIAHVTTRRKEAEKAAHFLRLTPAGWANRPARHLWREMDAVYNEISAAIAKHNIDQLWAPAYEGGNADHDATNALASCFPALSVLEFAEYNFLKGKARSQQFPFPNGTETILPLTPQAALQKQSALDLYASEKNNLNYVKTREESFRPLASYNYAAPPHKGTLWYARFQWVPFRHPRVDFTSSKDVCSAITSFLKTHKPN